MGASLGPAQNAGLVADELCAEALGAGPGHGFQPSTSSGQAGARVGTAGPASCPGESTALEAFTCSLSVCHLPPVALGCRPHGVRASRVGPAGPVFRGWRATGFGRPELGLLGLFSGVGGPRSQGSLRSRAEPGHANCSSPPTGAAFPSFSSFSPFLPLSRSPLPTGSPGAQRGVGAAGPPPSRPPPSFPGSLLNGGKLGPWRFAAPSLCWGLWRPFCLSHPPPL